MSINMTNIAVWFAIALVFITAIITKVAGRRIMFHPMCNRPPPPVVNCVSMAGLLHTLFTKGLQEMISDQYTKLGSVFTVRFVGVKLTFLVGPEVSGHFYQGLDSEVSPNVLEFTVPMTSKYVGYRIDTTTRVEQTCFYIDALKPCKLRRHVDSMLQEVEGYFAKWGQQGMVDLRQELEQLLTLITGRCLLGKEVREKMFNDFFTLFHEMIDNGICLTSVLFPYAPTPANRIRDRAHAKLLEMFTKIVRSRKSSNQVEEDVLQNLIDSKYRDGRSTTESEVTGLMFSLLIAGEHTSSATSTWMGAQLLNNERCWMAAIEEQKQIIRKNGRYIDYNVLLEMDVLYRCIKETLRLHPIAPSLFRKVHKNFTVRTKEGIEYEIPRGHTIVSPIAFNNCMPNIYNNPDVYDPDRFGPPREEDKIAGQFSYTAFGGGVHACFGEAYSYTQIKVIWSHLLRNFELKMVSVFPETDWSKLMLGPKEKVMVRYKRQRLPIT